jgi:hypothetical protein
MFLLPPGVSTFAAEETLSLSSLNSNASDEELRFLNHLRSSFTPRAKHSLVKELNLATVSGLICRKIKIYERIRN